MKTAGLALCCLFLGSQLSSGQASGDPVDRLIGGTRTGSLGCGPRAVYLLLTSLGLQVSLEQVETAIDPDGDGISNAADIIRYLRSLSVNARLVRCAYADLLSSSCRYILVLRNANNHDVFHFALAEYSKKDGQLSLFDPTVSARPVLLTVNDLGQKSWDGTCIFIPGK